MWLLSFGGSISRAVQRFALFNHQQLSLREEICQLRVTELSRKQKKLSRTAFGFSWELLPAWQLQKVAFLLQRGTTVPREPG